MKKLAKEYLKLKIEQKRITQRIDEIRKIVENCKDEVFDFNEGKVILKSLITYSYDEDVRQDILNIRRQAREDGNVTVTSRKMFFYIAKSSKKSD